MCKCRDTYSVTSIVGVGRWSCLYESVPMPLFGDHCQKLQKLLKLINLAYVGPRNYANIWGQCVIPVIYSFIYSFILVKLDKLFLFTISLTKIKSQRAGKYKIMRVKYKIITVESLNRANVRSHNS